MSHATTVIIHSAISIRFSNTRGLKLDVMYLYCYLICRVHSYDLL